MKKSVAFCFIVQILHQFMCCEYRVSVNRSLQTFVYLYFIYYSFIKRRKKVLDLASRSLDRIVFVCLCMVNRQDENLSSYMRLLS
jgi:hypothetical protein